MSKISIEFTGFPPSTETKGADLCNCSKVLAENDLSLCMFCFLTSRVLFCLALQTVGTVRVLSLLRSWGLPVQWDVKEALALPSDLSMGVMRELGGSDEEATWKSIQKYDRVKGQQSKRPALGSEMCLCLLCAGGILIPVFSIFMYSCFLPMPPACRSRTLHLQISSGFWQSP